MAYKGKISFGESCYQLLSEHNKNLKSLVYETTEMFFKLIKKPTIQVRRAKKLMVGKFYLIFYNYNGNRIWCPIFVIDDRVNAELQKRIVYAINLEYIPYRYKIVFFDKIFKLFELIVDQNQKNIDNEVEVNNERPFKVSFESIYRHLKNNGNFSYCITAFDYSKIEGGKKGMREIYAISTSITDRLMFIDCKLINKRIMMEKLKELEVDILKDKILEILGVYEKTTFDFENDVKKYYEQLKSIESKYKLFED